MLQALIESQDFLKFTLDNPHHIDESGTFSLGEHTQVEVWDTGVIVFEPKQGEGKDIVLSCAVHGNETAPIELCNDLIKDLLQQKIITKHRVLFLFGNPPAIINGTRFIEENLNRLFNGAHSVGEGLSNPERIRAKKLEFYVDKFFSASSATEQRIHYDLHTAIRGSKHEKFAIYPYRPGRQYSAQQIMYLEACGIDTVLFHHEPTTTFSYFSSKHYEADAFTIELGKVLPFGQNDMTRFIALREMLNRLITNQDLELDEFDADKVNLYQVCRAINKSCDDFEFTFANDVENFTAFPKGYILAKEGGMDIKVEHEVEAIVFPNAKVPVGQRTVLCLKPASTENIA
ncbi:succinylglutamate desuccinylase [Shewanella violacea]|uniref:Succinylglutamate desuccinylase n=1 Tax=Shewanella violacea (strain JCM 10179 / CIP 106290 / LMG 19151 / DSS12) TaxID=637905 RepID=D4ZK13_SHEVD|nr:succinylglutamate desuccinylase [Shewanella violacea]BAJ02012.1 succinylglutamate desuccinylase [Shewanella violacea DSS12]